MGGSVPNLATANASADVLDSTVVSPALAPSSYLL